MGSNEHGEVTVQRPIFIEYFDGSVEIIQLNLRCDPGNHMAPLFGISVSYSGHNFRFKKDIVVNKNLKRPLYVECVPGHEEDEDYVPTEAEQIKTLEAHCASQHKQLLELVSRINDLNQIATGQQQIIESYKKQHLPKS